VLDNVGEALELLDVDRAITVMPASSRSSTSCQRSACADPGVGVRQLVDQRGRRMTLENRHRVQLLNSHRPYAESACAYDAGRLRLGGLNVQAPCRHGGDEGGSSR
jgi:hypothetical protein